MALWKSRYSCGQNINNWKAKLLGISDRKGKIEVGYDADLIVFNPSKQFEISKSGLIWHWNTLILLVLVHKNKLSPYERSTLIGQVEKTILRGKVIFENNSFTTNEPQGNFVFSRHKK